MNLDKTKKMKNGGILYGLKPYRANDKNLKSVLAYFPLSHQPFVSWVYNISDDGYFDGVYCDSLQEAFKKFINRGDPLILDQFDSIELHCTKHLFINNPVNLCVDFDAYTFYGKSITLHKSAQHITDIYSIEIAIQFGHWLYHKFGIPVYNEMKLHD